MFTFQFLLQLQSPKRITDTSIFNSDYRPMLFSESPIRVVGVASICSGQWYSYSTCCSTNAISSKTLIHFIHRPISCAVPGHSLMSMSMSIYTAHKHETSNALNALVRSKHKRFQMLPKSISANSRITQEVRQRVPHRRTSHRESPSGRLQLLAPLVRIG